MHYFFYQLGGYFFTLGFRNNATREGFTAEFENALLSPKAKSRIPCHFSASGWKAAGRMAVDGQLLSIALFTPRAFAALIHRHVYEKVDPEVYELVNDGYFAGRRTSTITTPRGTTYICDEAQKPLGILTDRGAFRLREKPDAARELPYASHEAILRRQMDPYGMGVLPRTMNEKIRQGQNVIRTVLADVKIDTPSENSATSLPKPRALKARIEERLTRLQTVLSQRADLSPMQQSLQKVSLGLHPDLLNADPSTTKVVRFIWLNPGSEHAALVAANDNLLHLQLAEIALGSQVIEGGLAEKRANGLKRILRGGALQINYDDDGAIEGIDILDDTMIVPSHTDPENGERIVMSAEERKALRTFFKERR